MSDPIPPTDDVEHVDKVTEPGLYVMEAEAYHADPVPGGSLSQSGAKLLLPPSCPAKFRWEQDHPSPPSSAQERGTAAHTLVLGDGPGLACIDAPDWRTKAAKEAVEVARAEGKIPLHAADFRRVNDMAAALRRHPTAAALFDPEHGAPERSIFWQDERTDVWRRARFDWLPEASDGRLIIPDYKTCGSAEPSAISRSVDQWRYHQQAPWYLDAAKAVLGVPDPVFVFVFQEKDPPYLVTVVELDVEAMRIGAELNRRALEVYAECSAVDVWPPYSNEIELVGLPAWAVNRHRGEYR